MAKIYDDQWQIVRSLRPGGQAETFVVRDVKRTDGTEFVLKRLKNLKRHQRFGVEVGILRELDHPNVVKIVDGKLDADQPYLVTEYCPAGSLDAYEGRWKGNPAAALRLFAQVCDGVAAAHAKGVVHRDIKPANILLRTPDGPPVVADFGIAFIDNGERLTLTDEAVGARSYTAPELADGRADIVSARADVYSLGKLLYWLVSGRVFDRERHREERYDLARQPGGRVDLEFISRLLDRMLVEDPLKRLADASVVAASARAAADFIENGVRVLSHDLPLLCSFCRHGEYVAVKTDSATDIRNLGLSPVGSAQWKVLVCQYCGNVQLFRPDHTDSRRWWGPAGTVSPLPL